VVGEIIKIYEKYPPLATRVQFQLEYMKACIGGQKTIAEYLESRGGKFEGQAALAEARNQVPMVEPSYFNV
jgi:hypothetical protein